MTLRRLFHRLGKRDGSSPSRRSRYCCNSVVSPMYYFVIHARPNPDKERDEQAADAAGAYVCCWIDFKDFEGAELLARHYIVQAGWIPDELDPDQTRSPARSDYVDDELGRRYFDEAMETGVCLSFHLYPAEDDATA